MAPQKPRFGGAQICMNEYQELTKQIQTMATHSDSGRFPDLAGGQREILGKEELGYDFSIDDNMGVSYHSLPEAAVRGGNCGVGDTSLVGNDVMGMSATQMADGEFEMDRDLKRLMEVFRHLGFKAKPRPYNRHHGGQLLSSGGTDDKEEVSTEEEGLTFCKNLFLKDRRGQFYIVICPEGDVVDLKWLKQQLSAHRNLSFADDGALKEILHLSPGEVTPLALMHESARGVRVAVLETISNSGQDQPDRKFAFHPLKGHLQVALSFAELQLFIRHFKRELEILRSSTEVQGKSRQRSADCVKSKCMSKGRKLKDESYVLKSEGTHKVKKDRIIKPSPDLRVSVDRDGGKTPGLTPSSNIQMASQTDIDEKGEIAATQIGIDDEIKVMAEPEDYAETESLGKGTEGNFQTATTVNNVTPCRPRCSEDIVSGLRLPDEAEIHHDEAAESKTSNPLRRCHRLSFFDRKGKLGSYMKRNVSGAEDRGRNVCTKGKDDSDIVEYSGIDNTFPRAVLQEKITGIETSTGSEYTMVESDNVKHRQDTGKKAESTQVQLSDIPQTRLLPEVEEFYKSLSDARVEYTEIDLSVEGGGGAVGPSIGCRCFLMKDKRDSFFFIISHELYEPDFGRLKAALKPRKKLIPANHVDVMLVLGTDPSKMTPFAARTLRDRNVQFFFTRKVTAPSLVFSIQHPFAGARRIIMSFSELQKFLHSLGIVFGVVEEKVWPPRYNFPFSQFDRVDKDSAAQHAQSMCNVENPREESCLEKAHLEISNEQETSRDCRYQGMFLARLVVQSLFSQILSLEPVAMSIVGVNILYRSIHSLASFAFHSPNTPQRSPNSQPIDTMASSPSSSVDRILLGNTTTSARSNKDETKTRTDNCYTGAKSKDHKSTRMSSLGFTGTVISEAAVSMTTDELEKHLVYFGVTFKLKENRVSDNDHRWVKYGADSSKTDEDEGGNNVTGDFRNYDVADDNIVERCMVMHLYSEAGHNYIIVGSESDYPISVRRFCRRTRVGCHLRIILDPTRGSNPSVNDSHDSVTNLTTDRPYITPGWLEINGNGSSSNNGGDICPSTTMTRTRTTPEQDQGDYIVQDAIFPTTGEIGGIGNSGNISALNANSDRNSDGKTNISNAGNNSNVEDADGTTSRTTTTTTTIKNSLDSITRTTNNNNSNIEDVDVTTSRTTTTTTSTINNRLDSNTRTTNNNSNVEDADVTTSRTTTTPTINNNLDSNTRTTNNNNNNSNVDDADVTTSRTSRTTTTTTINNSLDSNARTTNNNNNNTCSNYQANSIRSAIHISSKNHNSSSSSSTKQDTSNNPIFHDCASPMLPFAMGMIYSTQHSSSDTAMGPSRSRSTHNTAHTTVDNDTRHTQPNLGPDNLRELPPKIAHPDVTVALTTTLYIDPETVMEFRVGPERSRLRMTSSEFEDYVRKMGFQLLYY